jgi:hypothetical protein
MAIQSTIKNILSKTATAFAIAVVTASAHAAGAAGGLTKAEKKQWSDVGMGVVHVAVAGSVLGLVGWAWTLMA